jgi:spore germination cell wall hydrolase CwlJ-like protein
MDHTANQKRRDRRQALGVLTVSVAALGLVFAFWWLLAEGAGHGRLTPADIRKRAEAAKQVPPTVAPQDYKPLSPDAAVAENASLPFSMAPIESAPPLVVPLNASAFAERRSAMDCLTAAIYYEAAQESETGKRSVAQVILNRARHPAFPDSICGVVYQGSERRTGCQFTFTCDGSLARKPSRAGWDAARRIALAALSGYVERSVGMATHYHADYVVPYWAPSLAKIAQVDHHIFYRWSGGWGRRAAFNQSVSQEQLLDDQPQIVGTEDFEMNPVMPEPLTGVLPSKSRIAADEAAGALADGDKPVLPAPGPLPSIRADAAPAKPAADTAKGSLRLD